MSRILSALGALAFALVGCSSDRTFDMTWKLTSTGACTGAGIDPRYAREQEVTLRYARRPNHLKLICSNKLAAALAAATGPTVPMVERRNGGPGSSTSICSIAGLTLDVPGAACTFEGQVGGGFENEGKPTPWDD
jgi:hypothetical protein